ncbi:unnamed protein product [marine sediment metagenome]|uniref:HK97 gp10 family phage protein n=1 Tax=marine sediment metagenome TaxID=412755 RepID=X1LYT8_9ZZZZ
MKLKVDMKLNLKTKEAQNKVKRAGERGLKDVIVAIAGDVIKGSPKLTGNNARSIMYEAKELEGSIYSTSGYGGYLETGTVSMPARPYFRPALDKNMKDLPKNIKGHLR